MSAKASFQRINRGAAWLTWATLWFPACSLLLPAGNKQCTSDADCNVRGLLGAVCLAEVCQRPAAAVGGGAGAVAVGASSETPATGTSTRENGVSTMPVAGGGGERSAAPVVTGGARAVDSAGALALAGAMAGSPARAGSGGSSGKAAAGTDTPCVGAACPECSVDADCERLGMPVGSACRSATCWPAIPECKTDADCLARGAEFMGGKCAVSQCLPNPRWRCDPAVVATTSETKKLRMLVRDSLSLNPVPNVHVVACQKLDLTCSQPAKDATTGSDGFLSIELPANFAGYLQQTERSEYAPAMYFLPQVFPVDGVLQPFPLLGSGVIIDALAAALGAGIDPKRGHLMLISEDCMGMALAGSSFSSPQRDAQTVQFYVRDLLPSPSATDTAEVGNGGFLNFPSGTAIINVTQTKTKLELSTVSVVVRPGYISVAYIRPRVR